MSFQDLQSGAKPSPSSSVGVRSRGQSPSQAVAAGIFQINTAIAAFHRLVDAIGTDKDTSDHRQKLHNTRQRILQLVKDTSAKLKALTDSDRDSSVNPSKKVEDAKLARDFQITLQEFQKAQQLASERESTYSPSAPPPSSSLSATSASGEHFAINENRPFLFEQKRQEVLLLDNEISFNEAMIEEREQGIREVEEQIGQANEIFKDLAVLVHEQGVVIDDIQSNVGTSSASTTQARVQLAKASKSGKSKSSWAGIISPSKLRMKLIGPHHHRKTSGSNSNSARTSPSRLEDSDFVNNSLLGSNNGGFDEEVTSPILEVSGLKLSSEPVFKQTSCQQKDSLQKENGVLGRINMHQFSKFESGNSSTINPVRSIEEDNLDYDSNASSSSFEFHKGERSVHNPCTRSSSRSMPSKWDDAEKWIMNRQNVQAQSAKISQNQANQLPLTNTVRVAPESANYDHKDTVSKTAETKKVDFCQHVSHMGLGKFSFVSNGSRPILDQAGGNALTDPGLLSEDLKEVGHRDLSCTKTEDMTGSPAIRSVSMRDMGTEMTPATSQEPSRTATPVGATTPLCSPTSSIPSTPHRGAPAPTPVENTDEESQNPMENRQKELSEEELKLKTRREIVALGVQLGKMNIAEWANKDDQKKKPRAQTISIGQLERFEFEKRAAAWEEAEKSKHMARYKSEEIKIQAWESRQKAKAEEEMQRKESQVQQMRAQVQAKMVKKIAMTRQRSEEKRGAAEAKKNREVERTAAQAECMRQKGRLPSTHYICCGWLS